MTKKVKYRNECYWEYEYLGGLDNTDLIIGHIYKRVEDKNDFRIVDESGEDYIYPQDFFKQVK